MASIGANAFCYCSQLTEISIPDNVISIGNGAFELCLALESVTIGSGLATLGENVFADSDILTDINVVAGNLTFSSFEGILLSGDGSAIIEVPLAKAGLLTIPGSVINIETRTFDNLDSLTEIIIENGVQSIREEAFYDCYNITSISIPESVSNIEPKAFSRCSNLDNYTVNASNPVYCSADGIIFNKAKTTLVVYPQTRSDDYTIPDGVTTIAPWAFYYAGTYDFSSRMNIHIPEHVTFIGEQAFAEGDALMALRFAGSPPSIGGDLFDGARSIYSTYPYGSPGWPYIFGGGVAILEGLSYTWNHSDGATITGYPIPTEDFVVPSYIGVIPVTKIGEEAFSSNVNFRRITLPDTIDTIDDYAFSDCSNLQSIDVGDNLETLGARAFRNCANLNSITLPATLKFTGSSAFDGCSNLKNIYFEGDKPDPIVFNLGPFGDLSDFRVYRHPHANDWGEDYYGANPVIWDPRLQSFSNDHGESGNQFGITITSSDQMMADIEFAENAAGWKWIPEGPLMIVGDTATFVDPDSATAQSRIYRLRMPR